MHLPQEMTATMRYQDLTAEPKKLHLLDQQGEVERLGTEQGRPGDGHDRLLGTAEHSKASCNGCPADWRTNHCSELGIYWSGHGGRAPTRAGTGRIAKGVPSAHRSEDLSSRQRPDAPRLAPGRVRHLLRAGRGAQPVAQGKAAQRDSGAVSAELVPQRCPLQSPRRHGGATPHPLDSSARSAAAGFDASTTASQGSKLAACQDFQIWSNMTILLCLALMAQHLRSNA